MIKRESVRAYSMIVQQHPVFCYNHHTTILKSIFEGLLDRLQVHTRHSKQRPYTHTHTWEITIHTFGLDAFVAQDGTQEHADTHMNSALDSEGRRSSIHPSISPNNLSVLPCFLLSVVQSACLPSRGR